MELDKYWVNNNETGLYTETYLHSLKPVLPSNHKLNYAEYKIHMK